MTKEELLKKYGYSQSKSNVLDWENKKYEVIIPSSSISALTKSELKGLLERTIITMEMLKK